MSELEAMDEARAKVIAEWNHLERFDKTVLFLLLPITALQIWFTVHFRWYAWRWVG